MFVDVDNIDTFKRMLSKLNKMPLMKFVFSILKQTDMKHRLIVKSMFITCLYAHETEEFYVDFKISSRDMISVIIQIKKRVQRIFKNSIQKW